jgi:membrane-associated protein
LDFVIEFWNIITHLDVHLASWAVTMGPWLYVLLFVVVFCETGLVVTPFLPGDSLLFAVGALCSLGEANLQIGLMVPLLIVAAVLGDAANYAIGRAIGPRVFQSEGSIFLNRRHLDKAQDFYERYGGKTIVIARFVPIVRTFAPFVAGVGKMAYNRFVLFNVGGAILWVVLCSAGGYAFGNLPVVKRNFHVVLFGIILLSILPAVIEIWRERRRAVSRVA